MCIDFVNRIGTSDEKKNPWAYGSQHFVDISHLFNAGDEKTVILSTNGHKRGSWS